MTFIIITLCVALISGIITTFMNETMLNGLYDIVFHGDITMAQSTGANFFTTVTGIAFTFAMSLMVLKFLKKGFDIYVLWTDGDPDADPMLLLINFVRAVATALIFRWVYDIFVDACSVVTNTILTSIGAETNYTATLVTRIIIARSSTRYRLPYFLYLLSYSSLSIHRPRGGNAGNALRSTVSLPRTA